jgi:aldehyde dehydrogenase (NAD+)
MPPAAATPSATPQAASTPAARLGESTPLPRVQALFAQQKAHRWTVARSTAAERAERLGRLREAIARRREEVAQALWADFRKSPSETEASEVMPALLELRHAQKHVAKWMRPRKVKTPLTLAGTKSQVRYEPRGVTLILAPWNYPFQLVIAPLAGAIAAGNPVILKPSEKTPHTAALVAALIAEVFDEREVAVVQGGADVGAALLELPFDHFFFTGGPVVGRKVAQAAAKHLAAVTLELGGKSPAIVTRSADVEAAAEHVMYGKFLNAGQTCIAPDYVLVHASLERPFLEAAKAKLARFYGPTEEARQASPDLARLVDDASFQRLTRLVDGSLAAGARVESGNVRDPATRYLAPTLLSAVTRDMPVMREELFGPVLPVLPFTDLEAALEGVRGDDNPLALYAFGRDKAEVEQVLQGTAAGGTTVNNTLLHFVHPELPFGGAGNSGVGSYHGEASFRCFSHERGVVFQGRGPAGSRLFHPPYAGDRVVRAVRLLTRFLG